MTNIISTSDLTTKHSNHG